MSEKKEDRDMVSNQLSSEQVDQVVQEAKRKIQEAKGNVEQLKKTLQQSQTTQSTITTNPNGWTKSHKPRYEIELYEEVTDDDTGDIKGYRRVNSERPIYVEAASKADFVELAQRYQLCHQRMKVIRRVDEQPQAQCQQSEAQPTVASTNGIGVQQLQSNVSVKEKSKPRFYKLGDIEVKEENGKLYQKQWMKLSKSEASNLRIVNDKTNALVNLNGKHIEMKKWIQVENTEEDDTTSLEESLNG